MSCRIFLIVLLTILVNPIVSAQANKAAAVGYTSGIYSRSYMPALMLGSPYKLDVDILSTDFTIYTANDDSQSNTSFSTSSNFLNQIFESGTENDLLSGQLSALSGVYTINKKNAVAFNAGLRMNLLKRVSSSLLSDLLNNVGNEESGSGSFSQDFTTVYSNTWIQLGGTYIREIYSNDKFKNRTSVSANVISGLASAKIEIGKLNGTISDGVISDLDAEINIIFNDKIDALIEGGEVPFDLFSKIGYSFSFSTVFTFYDTPGNQSAGNYKFEVGTSLMNLGKIKYTTSPNSISILASGSSLNLDNLENTNSIQEFADSLASQLITDENIPTTYSINMPLKLYLYFDYNFGHHFYASLIPTFLFDNRLTEFVDDFPTYDILIVPRYEKDKWKVILPMSYNKFSKFQVGTGFSWRYINIGSDNIFSIAFDNSKVKSLNVYFGLRFNLMSKN
jgi:hypothetical protein